MKWLKNLFAVRKPAARNARLALEGLEARQLLSASPITFHGGTAPTSVSVDAIYYGKTWTNSAADLRVAVNDNLKDLVKNSPYLDTLKNGGYGTYSDTWAGSTISSTGAVSTDQVVTDDEVQAYLNNALHHPFTATQTRDCVVANSADRLYLVMVDPSYEVRDYNGVSSTNTLLGYHSTFTAILDGRPQVVHYAVVAAPGGSAENKAIANVIQSDVDTVTAVASREMVNTLTNPNGFGWFANSDTREVGDSGSYVYMNNTLVVRPLSKDREWMTPAQAAAGWDPALNVADNAPTFYLDTNGDLWERVKEYNTQTTQVLIDLTKVASNVVKLSDQGIDNYGRAQVCYITADGKAYEYHDGGKRQLLYAPSPAANSPVVPSAGVSVVDAKAGQGVSYVLLSNGEVWEYDQKSKKVDRRDTCDKAIDAGTTTEGVNRVVVIRTNCEAWDVPDNDSKHELMDNVLQASAGRQGVTALLGKNHVAHVYDDCRGGLLSDTWSGVSKLSAGFSATGTFVMDLLTVAGTLVEVDFNAKLTTKHEHFGAETGALAVSKTRAGVVDMIFSDGAYEGTVAGSKEFLGDNIKRAV